METTEVIEINGRRYNAHTGQPVSEQKHHVAVHHQAEHHSTKTNHLRHHAPISSRLLMRKGVKKPAATTKSHLKARGPVKHKQPVSELAPVRRAARRLEHAKHTAKSARITHFITFPPSPYPVETVFKPNQPKAEQVVVRVEPAKPQRSATDELLEKALRAATAHEQKPLPKRHHRRHIFAKAHA